MSREALLPFRCLITGEPAAIYSPWPLSNWSFGKAQIQAPLCFGVLLSNFLYGLLAALLVVGGVVCLLGGPRLMQSGSSLGLFLVIAGSPLILAGVVCSWFCIRSLGLERTSENHLWISGVHPAYLDGLPAWPYESQAT